MEWKNTVSLMSLDLLCMVFSDGRKFHANASNERL